MQKWFSDLGKYLGALLMRAAGYITGGILAAVYVVYSAFGGAIHPWQIWALVSAAFFAAGFSLWRNDKQTREMATAGHGTQVAALNGRIAALGDPERRERELAEFSESFHDLYTEGKALERAYNDEQPVSVPTSEKVVKWQERVKASLSGKIRKNLFMQYEEISPAGSWIRDAHEGIRQESSKLAQQVAFLQRIIHNPQAFKPPL